MSAYFIHIIKKFKLDIRIVSEHQQAKEMLLVVQFAPEHQSSTAIEIESIKLPSKKPIREKDNVSIVNGKLEAKVEASRLRERL